MKVAFLSTLVWWVVRALAATSRIEIHGLDNLDPSRPGILTFWHEHMLLFTILRIRRLDDASWPLVGMASRSRDGELAARIAEKANVRVMRGSSSSGGARALRQIHRAVRKEGLRPVAIPDGPRGPAREAKAGFVVLAQLTGQPLLPIGLAASGYKRIGSWDRMVVPRPFSRLRVVVGAPLKIPTRLEPEALTQWQGRVAEAMESARLAAEASFPDHQETTETRR